MANPERPLDLTAAEKHVLVHTLTGSSRAGTVYRNFFAAHPGHADMASIERLVAAGLMIAGRKFDEDGCYFHCTRAGAAVINLHLPRDD